MSRAVATSVLISGRCNPATSSAVMIRAGPLLNLLQEYQNARSMLTLKEKYFSRELQAASTLSSEVTSDRGAKAFFTPATATEKSTSSSSQYRTCRARASRNFSSTLDTTENVFDRHAQMCFCSNYNIERTCRLTVCPLLLCLTLRL